jgi:hypothetical protein
VDLLGGRLDTQVPQFSLTADQAADDLAQALGLPYLTKQHGHNLIPGTEAFGIAFGAVSKDLLMKPLPVEQSYLLTEQARMPYHSSSSLPDFLRLLLWRT